MEPAPLKYWRNSSKHVRRQVGNFVHKTHQFYQLPIHQHVYQLGVTTNISLNTAKFNVVNISAPEFRKWQQLEDHWNGTLLHHLVNIPSVPTDKLHKQMITSDRPVKPFLFTDESIGETVSVWTLFSHAGVYVMAIGSLIPVGLGIFCGYFFQWQPARLVC